MCLSVDPLYHKATKSKQPQPRIAQRDIVVWKVLESPSYHERVKHKSALVSPYQRTPYKLGERMNKNIKVRGNRTFKYYVYEGLHSYRTRIGCYNIASTEKDIYPAIIPRGSKVFFGLSGKVVSSSLIVYANMAALEKVHGPVGDGVPRTEIAL